MRTSLDLALAASGCASAKARLLSDNGPSCIAGELAEYIEANKMSHARAAPMHPQTQGKIEAFVERYTPQTRPTLR